MYLSSNQSMQLLKITTRQGLFKIVKNHNITVKSQGVGRPNLYLKSDLEKYMVDNAKNIKIRKNPQVIEKAEKIVKDIKNVKKNIDKQKEKVEKKIEKISAKNITIDVIEEDSEIQSVLNNIGMNKYLSTKRQLEEMGIFNKIDKDTLLSYSMSYQNVISAQIAYDLDKGICYDFQGNAKKSPSADLLKQHQKELRDNADRLGLNIRARQGLEIKEKKKESIFDILNAKESFE